MHQVTAATATTAGPPTPQTLPEAAQETASTPPPSFSSLAIMEAVNWVQPTKEPSSRLSGLGPAQCQRFESQDNR